MSSDVLRSRWLLVALMVMGVALGVITAERLDQLAGPANAELIMDD